MVGFAVMIYIGLLIAGVVPPPLPENNSFWLFLVGPWRELFRQWGIADAFEEWRGVIGWGWVALVLWGRRRAVWRAILWPFRHAYWLRRIFGGRIFGSARWATPRDLKRAGMLERGGLFLGSLQGREFFHNGEGHLVTIGGTGGGKSSGLVVPTLLTLTEGSVIVTDPSGELAAMTSRHRAEIGPVVFLNPFAATFARQSALTFDDAGFNPFSILDPKSPNFISDVNAFARLLMVTDRRESGSYWNDEGAEFLSLMIASIILYDAVDLHNLAFLYRVVRDTPDGMELRLKQIIKRDHPALRDDAERFIGIISKAAPQWAGIASKAALATKRYAPSTPLGEHTAKNGFDAALLKSQKVTVYVLVPTSLLPTALPWLNLLVGLFAQVIALPGSPAPVTMLVDETPSLGFIPDLIPAMALYRKAGLRMWLFTQTYAAMAAPELYGREGMQTLMGLAMVKQFFALDEPEVQDMVSKLCGQRSVSNPSSTGSTGDVGQPLIRPDQVRGLQKWTQIIVRGNLLFPIKARLVPYFNHPKLKSLADANPYRGK